MIQMPAVQLRTKLTAAVRRLIGSRETIWMSRNRRYRRFRVGDWSYGNPDVIYWGCNATLVVGRFCSIAPGVSILLGGEHHVEWVTTYPFSMLFPEAAGFPGYPLSSGDVVLGNDVWIGQEALILSGVRLGNGCVVAARSVVTRDVPPYAIVAGAPARIVKYRFDESIRQALDRIAWWDWPLAAVKEAWPLLMSERVREFVDRYAGEGENAG
jgi:virginiamycin A acetyltransferase